MPFIKLQFRPGVNRDQTNYTGESGWWACDKVRFRSGAPEKIGGWVKKTPTSFIGTCRQLWSWITTFSDNFVGVSTNEKVYIEQAGNLYDITPLASTLATTDTDNCIYTTDGSTTVTVDLGAVTHGASTGSYVTVSGVTGDVGGVPNSEVNANHEITVIDVNSFSFEVSTAATSTVSGGGGTAIDLEFEIEPGNAIAVEGLGWGAGTWGRTTWGLGAESGGIDLPQRDWWFDNFDNDLVMNIRNGAGYWWERGTTADPTTALGTRAISLVDYAGNAGYTTSSVPTKIMQLMVSQQDRHLIAFGAVPFGYTNTADFDPMLIRWADQDTPGDWTPSTTNTAGSIRVSRGSRIVRALPTRQEILVFTDTNLYSMQFTGTLDVFALQEYETNMSVISPRAMTSASNVVFWMGKDKFYAYTGRVETLPCTLMDHVFSDINFEQGAQVVCGTNEGWNEVWWFYPTANSSYNNAYVVFNYAEQIWYYGTIERTAWLDTPLSAYPLAANTVGGTTAGYIYEHENGLDADTEAMEAYIQSNDFDMGDGDQFMLSRRIIPDVKFLGSTATTPEVTFEVRHRNFPGSPLATEDEDNARVIRTAVEQYTEQVFIRARARQMALKVMSDQSGVQWQVGAPRLDARPDGRR